MSFIVYDLAFLVASTLAVVLFLYTRKHNLKREGLLYLYRTKIGIKFIEWTSKKFSKILMPLQYVILASGYLLMILMVWYFFKFSYMYLASPGLAEQLRVPILTPLVPYIDKLFAVDFLPPFYFTYWIVIIAIIAIPHEFAHGIFARLNKIKIHSTGFGFLGPFLAAFVEQDEKDMNKSSKFAQLSVLAAGTFANILTAILFGIILWLFIIATMSPIGVYFNTYSTAIINTEDINLVNGLPILDAQINESSQFVNLEANNRSYLVPPSILKRTLDEQRPQIGVYDDAPAVKSELSGAILSVNGNKITSFDDLRTQIATHSPGEQITIKTLIDEKTKETKDYELTLADRDGNPFLGIGIIPQQTTGLRGIIMNSIIKIKDPMVYYESKLGDFGTFIYDLLWWTILISISVALVNMLPVGIFDGGRFFYLTIWGITGSKKIGEKAFKASTWLMLILILVLMIRWVFIFF